MYRNLIRRLLIFVIIPLLGIWFVGQMAEPPHEWPQEIQGFIGLWIVCGIFIWSALPND